MPSRKFAESVNRRLAGVVLLLTGVGCVLGNAFLSQQGREASASRGGGFLFIAGALAFLIGAVLLITGRPIGPEE
ncbi:MAG: hypothetical protein WKF30_08885 [Pyrinomonadaceae bacterium]